MRFYFYKFIIYFLTIFFFCNTCMLENLELYIHESFIAIFILYFLFFLKLFFKKIYKFIKYLIFFILFFYFCFFIYIVFFKPVIVLDPNITYYKIINKYYYFNTKKELDAFIFSFFNKVTKSQLDLFLLKSLKNDNLNDVIFLPEYNNLLVYFYKEFYISKQLNIPFNNLYSFYIKINDSNLIESNYLINKLVCGQEYAEIYKEYQVNMPKYCVCLTFPEKLEMGFVLDDEGMFRIPIYEEQAKIVLECLKKKFNK